MMRMGGFLSMVSLVVGLLALVKSTLERRAPNQLPISELVRDRFPNPAANDIGLGLIIGTLSVLGPLALFSGLGLTQLRPANPTGGNVWFLGLATILIKLVWAAIEELIFRGAVLPQVSKLTNGLVGLMVSALLFTWGHLERSGDRAPDLLSLLVFALDGVGFGIAYLAMQSLWMPTLWHATKNICIWLLFSESTLQLTQGIWQTSYAGPLLWVGSPHQAGLIDVSASALALIALIALYRRQIVEGLIWVMTQ